MSLISASIKPTIKASFIANVLAGYQRYHSDTESLLASVNLDPIHHLAEQRISVAKFYELTCAIEQSLEDEMLGFLAKPAPLRGIEKLIGIAIKLPTLGDALEAYSDFYSLFNHGHSLLSLELKQGKTTIRVTPENNFQKNSPYFNQRMLLTSYKWLCWLAKTRFQLESVEFSFPVKKDLDEFRFVFDCSAIQSSQESQMIFSNEILSLPIVRTKEEAPDFYKNFNLYTLLWPSMNSLSTIIREIIGSDLTSGFPSFDTVAAKMSMSPQTLSRRLNEAGISYQAIKDAIRRDAAIALLANSDYTIKEIAYQVGFKETASFSKAFKIWLGQAPSDYRRSSVNKIV